MGNLETNNTDGTSLNLEQHNEMICTNLFTSLNFLFVLIVPLINILYNLTLCYIQIHHFKGYTGSPVRHFSLREENKLVYNITL